MLSLPFPVRLATLTATAVTQMSVTDPHGFHTKVAERFRQSRLPVPKRALNPLRPSPKISTVDQLIRQGELSEAVRLIDARPRLTWAQKNVRRVVEERLHQLTTEPSPVTNYSQTTEHRVLFYLTNSLPDTQSGYTIRSHMTLKSIHAEGVDAHAITRLGYPIVVGRIPHGDKQVVEGITYERILPPLYPTTLGQRDQLSVEFLIKTAREYKATILHTTTDFKNAIVTSRAAKALNIPWIYEFRGELERTWLSTLPESDRERAESSEFHRLARAQEIRCAQAANAVVALSDTSRQQLITRGVDDRKITVIPNALDDDEVGLPVDRDTARDALGLPKTDTLLIGSVSSVVDYEGFDTLLRALVFLDDHIHALIVGDGTARPGLEQLSQELGVNDRVIFAGRQSVDTIKLWYAALDLFVLPRKNLPVCRTVTPIKSLTAQGFGLPIVASDLPALREVTGGYAVYVQPDSPEALALGIRDALSRGADTPTQWLASRTWSANGRRYRKLYESL